MFLSAPPSDQLVKDVYDAANVEDGYVANYLRLWCWRPDVHAAFSNARALLLNRTSLTAREIAVLNTATARGLGDSYCSIAWGTKLANLIDSASAAAVLRRDAAPALSQRERALASWASAVVAQPNSATRQDVERMLAAGFSEQEIFDATTFVAFRLAFSTVNDALGAQPDPQLAKEAPPEVLASVRYGRSVAGAAADRSDRNDA